METVVTKLNEGTSELQQFDYNTLSSELLKNNFFGHVDFGLSRNLVDPTKLILNTEVGIVLDHVLEYLCFIGYLTKKGLDINSYLTLNFGVQIHIAIFIYQFLKKTPLGSPFIGYFFKSLGVHDSLSGYITKDNVQDTRPLKETIDFNTGTDVMLVSEEIIRKFTGVNAIMSVPFKMNYLQLKNLIKMDAMVEDQLSLDVYNVAFYAPKNIYLDQLNLIDNRLIYANKSLATYIQNDKIEIKARKLGEINSRKQQLLIELEVLKNEKS